MIPLYVRSHYSLMWGVNSIPQICRAAGRMGYKCLALTDTDNLYGLWTFIRACRQEGLRPIIGAEVTDPRRKRRAVCLVENQTGYRNLCRLLTRRRMDGEFDLQRDLPALAEGLVVLTKNAALLSNWHHQGVCLAANLPRRPLPSGHPLCRTARRLDIPLAATPGSFFLTPDDRPLHRLLRAIDGNTVLSKLTAADVAPADAWLAPPDVYRRRFAVCPRAIRTTEVLAERLTFHRPEFGVVMPPWQDSKGRTALACLRTRVYQGAQKRYGGELAEPVVERIEHELRIVAEMGFAAYFLVVHDIVSRGGRTCGRGSGAASIIAYCLGITNVCPLKHNLYFERFLNPGRRDPPDLDIDFAWDERDRVLDMVLTRYQDHAAMVASHVLFQPRMALRETAKVFGLGAREIGAVCRRLPHFFRMSASSDGRRSGRGGRTQLKNLPGGDPWPEIIRLSRRLIACPRYLSVHPGGIVITPRPVATYVPLERTPKGVPVMQWGKDAVETAGLIKIDLLGNRSLGVVRDALGNIRANHLSFDETRWEPEDDYATQVALAQGRTMGCFYIESPAMRLLQQKAGVGDFAHLVIHSSIIRPAANEFIQAYLQRLHGADWEPIHPLLADVLDDTFGIMVYQEDVSRAAVSVAGFSHAEADGLRKIMSRKDREHQLMDYRDRFYRGAEARGVDRRAVDRIWNMMMSFSGYSFCKPHSASYAKVSFQAAFLKQHYPAEFMAAVISNRGGFYSPFAYVSEARRMGLCIDPPDIHASQDRWQGKDRRLRVGLLSIKGLSRRRRRRLFAERNRAPFADLPDFLDRVAPDESEAGALVDSGALDGFAGAGDRAGLLWQWACWRKTHSDRRGPATLFAEGAEGNDDVPPLPPFSERRRLRREFAVLGFLCDRHPMQLYRAALKKHGVIAAAHLHRYVKRRVRFAGWLITAKRVQTRRGEDMQFLTFEDETGIVETTFFPRTYRRFRHMVVCNRPYLISGTVTQEWGVLTLTVAHVENASMRAWG